MNALVNSIAKKYISWDRNAEDVGFISLTKKAIKNIFGYLSDDEIKEVATSVGSTVPRDLLMLNFNTVTFDNIVLLLEIWNERFGKVRHTVSDSKHQFTIYHEINETFSKYIAFLHKAMAEDLMFNIKITNVTESAFSFLVEKK